MVEIIIPAYNCNKTLGRTLGSLIAQTDTNFKVSIIDDCSTEDLMLTINKFKELLNIRVIRNETNLGCGMTRQVGIDNATEDYIAFLDSDDVLMPYAVESWNNVSKNSPETDIFHAHFYEQRIKDNNPMLVYIDKGFTWTHGKLYKLSFIKKYGIKNSPEVRWADDSFFNSMCSELGKMSFIKCPLYLWLNNQASITRCGKVSKKEFIDDFLNAMLISVKFVKSKGKKEIRHAEGTLKLLEKDNIESFNDKELLEKYEELKKLLIKEE